MVLRAPSRRQYETNKAKSLQQASVDERLMTAINTINRDHADRRRGNGHRGPPT